MKFCSVRILSTMQHVTHYQCSKLFIKKIKLTVKLIVAHGVKADWSPHSVGKVFLM